MALPSAQPTLIVAQVLNPAYVGDGPRAGRSCSALQLGGCNLACTWCDVPFTWDGSRYDLERTLPRRVVHHLIDELCEPAPGLVLVTGGEPMLQQRSQGWAALLTGLVERGCEVEVHTNGTQVPSDVTLENVHRFVVSPKLAHSGEPAWTRVNDEALAAWAGLAREGRVDFSFVVRDRMDVLTVHTMVGLNEIPRTCVWISPQGRTAGEVQAGVRAIAESAVGAGFSLAPRLLLQ